MRSCYTHIRLISSTDSQSEHYLHAYWILYNRTNCTLLALAVLFFLLWWSTVEVILEGRREGLERFALVTTGFTISIAFETN